jgi:putative membrane protein
MDPTASQSGMTGTMTAEDVGVQPITGTSTADYVSQAAASDMFEIQAGRVAQGKAKNKEIRAFAATMVKDHGKSLAVLKAALDNAQRKLAPPSDQLPTDKQAMLDQLNHTPAGAAFDNLYLTQQLQAHQQAWALQKGYATDGDDAALRNVAAGVVPVVEKHLTMIKALQSTAG